MPRDGMIEMTAASAPEGPGAASARLGAARGGESAGVRGGAGARLAGLAIDLGYVCGLIVLIPWIAYLLLVRRRGLGSLRERFGLVPRAAPGVPRVWVHAVSVGELEAALPLLGALAERSPALDIALSTTTAAAQALARRRFPARTIFYCPLDFSFAVRAALRRAAPSALVLMELELWPNLLLAAGAAGVPVIVANGRISARGFARMKRARFLLRPLLARIDRVLAQDATAGERFLSLGVTPERAAVIGNLKFDRPVLAEGAAVRRDFETVWGYAPGSPRWIAGCTHAGEEAALLDAHALLRASFPAATIIIAPRHVERTDDVLRLARERGLRAERYSAGGAAAPPDAIVLDVTGELARLYAAADAAFVGGSLIPHGGHNPLEPILAGIPLAHGPHMENFGEVMRLLGDAGGAVRRAAAPAEIAGHLERWLRDPAERAASVARAMAAVARHRGAAERSADAILAALARGTRGEP
ncbi:MAG: 3-deoxy-D-manno-octulosonic acid transferase [Planctomycetes bacterium]|nr:3-deoxy-D-manno-octulosonic acid transferase [Planctomycetota bacterium]